MNQTLDDLREGGELLMQELLSLLLSLAKKRRAFDGSELEKNLREGLGDIGGFGELCARNARPSDEVLSKLAHAGDLLRNSAPLVADDEDAKATLTDTLEYLEKFRAQAIELMVAFDRSKTETRPATDPSAYPFSAAPGIPMVIRGVRVTIPRLIGLEAEEEPAPPSRTPAREDDDEAPMSLDPRRGPAALPQSRAGDAEERVQIERLARETMEDLAALFTLRSVSDREPWKEGKPFDQRLLANFHALVALAIPRRRDAAALDLTESLFTYATEWVVPDLGRTFAFAFVLACCDSPSAPVGLAMALRRADPRTLRAYTESLCLGSNPSLIGKMLHLLPEDAASSSYVVVLDAAFRRNVFHRKMISLSSHPDATVSVSATRCMAHAPPAIAAATLRAAVTSSHPSVRVAAGTTLLELGIDEGKEGKEALRQELDAFNARDDSTWQASRAMAVMALRALTVNADKRDADRVWAAAHRLRAYREVGFYGHAPHVPHLLGALHELSSSDGVEARDQRWCAAGAIKRITGISLSDYGTGYPDIDALTKGFTVWSKSDRPTNVRYRFSREWVATVVAPELADPMTHHGDRRILALELVHGSGGKLRFDVDGWIENQRSFLEMVTKA